MKWIEGVPEWLHKAGIRQKDFGYFTRFQLESQMRPGPGHTVRSQLWAVGMLYGPKHHGELATIWRKDLTGMMRKVPMTPSDMSRKLIDAAVDYYQAADLSEDERIRLRGQLRAQYSKERIRRALAEMEEDGCAERRRADGRPLRELSPDALRRLPSGQVHTYFFAIPKPPNPETVKAEWANLEENMSPLAIVPDDASTSEVCMKWLPLVCIPKIFKVLKIDVLEVFTTSSPFLLSGETPKSAKEVGNQFHAALAKEEYHEKLLKAWEASRALFIKEVREVIEAESAASVASVEVAATGVPDVPATPIPEVAATGRQEVIGVVKEGVIPKAPPSDESLDHHQHPPLKERTARKTPSKDADDEKTKTNPAGKEYANGREHLKAIYLAKTGEHAPIDFIDRLEYILVNQGRTFEEFVAALVDGQHLSSQWKNAPGLLTNLSRTLFLPRTGPPKEKPKLKCPVCMADNQRGAILRDGAIVPCPECSTPEWIAELERKVRPSHLAAAGD